MPDNIEQLLNQLSPRGLGAELRGDILDAMTAELRTAPTSPWLRRCGWAVAASIVVGIALNVAASRASQRNMAAIFGPPPVSRRAMEVAKAVEEITDAKTGQWVYERLTAPPPPRDAMAIYVKHLATVQRLIGEMQFVSKGFDHETPEKDTEMDRRGAGRTGGHRSGGQRDLCLDHRCTA